MDYFDRNSTDRAPSAPAPHTRCYFCPREATLFVGRNPADIPICEPCALAARAWRDRADERRKSFDGAPPPPIPSGEPVVTSAYWRH